ncbi:LPD7 domain-containing protein [Vibrio vulnificus]|uniref:LPD7 domain-containing protein n=1 Tax=Vibrio vulnificus TaxID=672 RepID=UPI00405A060C
MLARVRSNKQGIVDYLVNGNKSGRELSRDELDERVCIDGDLNITDEIINQLNIEGREDNYLHVTLSFGERDISEEKITQAYNEYKSLLMSAYDTNEYNTYAEIHLPKVKSYTDKSTGEVVERFPHVHMVLPKRNLATGKSLNPFGKYKDNIEYHDAIQETVNRKFDLESPYDNQRKYRVVSDDSEFISRYKGDNFVGANKDFKVSLFNTINDKNIRSIEDFEAELSKHGVVSKGRAGSINEYYQVKLPDQKKNIRLKNTCFSEDYIIHRQLLKEKPSDKKIEKDLEHWINIRSGEMKYIHPSSPKNRADYYALSDEEKTDKLQSLNEQHIQKFKLGDLETRSKRRYREAMHTTLKEFSSLERGLPNQKLTKSVRKETTHEHITPPRRSTRSHQRGVERATHQIPTTTRDVVPSLSTRDVDGALGRKQGETTSLLSNHQHHHLGGRSGRRNRQLRRPVHDRRRRLAQGFKQGLKQGLPGVTARVQRQVEKPKSLVEQYQLSEQKNATYELSYFRRIRRELEPERLLDKLAETHGLVKGHYTIERAGDGSPRIRSQTRAFNVSDFCTKHMHMQWAETKGILDGLFQEQITDKAEQYAVNSIAFASSYTTDSFVTKKKLSRIHESLQLFKHLQNKEQFEDRNMSLSEMEARHRTVQPQETENAISKDELDLKSITDSYARQQLLAKQLTVKLSDIVATKDLKDQFVDFSDKNTGLKLFRDNGTKIIMNSRKPDVNHVAAAMVLASEKFGTVKISGTKEFKQQVIDVAVAKDLNVVFKDKRMQEQFIKAKEEAKQNANLASVSERYDQKDSLSKGSEQQHAAKQVKPSEFTQTAQVIKHALQSSEQIKNDFAKLDTNDPEQVQKMASKHVAVLDSVRGTVGEKYIEDAIVSCSENSGTYKKALSDLVSKATTKQDNAGNPQKSMDDAVVTLVSHGAARYLHNKDNDMSYFVELSNGETKWGVGLKDAVTNSKVKIGDAVKVERTGSEPVTVDGIIKDEQGNKVGRETMGVERAQWKVTVLGAKIDPEQVARGEQPVKTPDVKVEKQSADVYKVEYQRDKGALNLSVTINGQSPNTVDVGVLAKIQASDKFLKHYTIAQIESGELRQKQAAGVQPVSKSYDAQGKTIKVQEIKSNTNTLS